MKALSICGGGVRKFSEIFLCRSVICVPASWELRSPNQTSINALSSRAVLARAAYVRTLLSPEPSLDVFGSLTVFCILTIDYASSAGGVFIHPPGSMGMPGPVIE